MVFLPVLDASWLPPVTAAAALVALLGPSRPLLGRPPQTAWSLSAALGSSRPLSGRPWLPRGPTTSHEIAARGSQDRSKRCQDRSRRLPGSQGFLVSGKDGACGWLFPDKWPSEMPMFILDLVLCVLILILALMFIFVPMPNQRRQSAFFIQPSKAPTGTLEDTNGHPQECKLASLKMRAGGVKDVTWRPQGRQHASSRVPTGPLQGANWRSPGCRDIPGHLGTYLAMYFELFKDCTYTTATTEPVGLWFSCTHTHNRTKEVPKSLKMWPQGSFKTFRDEANYKK